MKKTLANLFVRKDGAVPSEASPTSAYTYSPLNRSEYIRLIRIAPGKAGEPLCGSLLHFSKASLPRYEALSYTWGSADITHSLITPSGRLGLASSLHSALQKLRLLEKDRLIWADAICINQMDNEEKGQQVSQMRSIYQNADRVVVFLGDENGDSRLAISLLKCIAITDFGPPQRVLVEHQFESLGLPNVAHPAWAAIKNLMKRPWFRRVWIIQECVVAKKVIILCDDWTEEWSTFEGGILKMLKNRIMEMNWARIGIPDSGDQDLRKGVFCIWMITWIRLHLHRGTRVPLLTLLTLCRSQEATKARDNLFALLGIAEHPNSQDLSPNYEEEFAVVVRRYAKFFLGTEYCMTLLQTASYRPGQSRFPSWIPDWTTTNLVQAAFGDTNGNGLYFAAGQSAPVKRLSEENPDTLIIRGGFYDVITTVCDDPWVLNQPLLHLGSEAPNPLGKLFLLSDQVMETLDSYPTGEDLPEVQWRTLIGNRLLEGRTMPDSFVHAPANLVSSYQAARKLNKRWYTEHHTAAIYHLSTDPSEKRQLEELMTRQGGPWASPDLVTAALPYMQCLNATYGWSFGRTQKGYVGLFPVKAQVGDTIHIFKGGPTPFILRKSNSFEGHFHLIGDGYIHGIMRGEALSSPGFQFRDVLLI